MRHLRAKTCLYSLLKSYCCPDNTLVLGYLYFGIFAGRSGPTFLSRGRVHLMLSVASARVTRGRFFVFVVMAALAALAMGAAVEQVGAQGSTILVSNEGELANAITTANTSSATAATTIQFENDIALSAALPDISASVPVIIDGGGFTFSRESSATGKWSMFRAENAAHLTVESLTITGGDAYDGAAIRQIGGDLTIIRSTLDGNSASIDLNSSSFGGGAISMSGGGALIISDSVLSNNSVSGAQFMSLGGAILFSGPELLISDSTFTGNSVMNGTGTARGGAIYQAGGVLTITDSTLSDNSATSTDADATGGVIFLQSGTSTITGSTINGNTAASTSAWAEGGAMMLKLTTSLEVTDSTLNGNSAIGRDNSTFDGDGSGGGAILQEAGDLSIANSTLNGNSATGGDGSGYGGAILQEAGTLSITESTLTSNHAVSSAVTASGGAISQGVATTELTIIDTLLAENSVSGNTYALGGAIRTRADEVTITGSTLAGNSATSTETDGWRGWGGALHQANGDATITNSTLTGNQSDDGGAIFVLDTGTTLSLYHVTISGNHARSEGGGIFASVSAQINLGNTIVAGNSIDAAGTQPDIMKLNGTPVSDTLVIDGTPTSVGHNIIGVDDGTGEDLLQDGVNGNQVGTPASPIDPVLHALNDNGGPTETMLPETGSPALSNANQTVYAAVDQRNIDRPQRNRVDIGAVEIEEFVGTDQIGLIDPPTTQTAGQNVTITAEAQDANGNAIGAGIDLHLIVERDGNPVDLAGVSTTQTTDASGQVTFTYTNQTVGTDDITVYFDLNETGSYDATDDPAATGQITWTPDAPDSISLSVDPETETTGQPVALEATVEDGFGNPVADGAEVTFQVDRDSTASVVGGNSWTVETQAGVASIAYTNSEAGTDVVTASAGDAPASDVSVNWVDEGSDDPETKQDCKKGGWKDYGFKNQGQCIKFVNTGKDSR